MHLQPTQLTTRKTARVVVWPEAARAAPGISFRPREGYRPDCYFNPTTGQSVPALAVAAGRDRLFELFLELLTPLGPTVDIILETSHAGGPPREIRRNGADRPVAASYLCDFEDDLLDDGCAGVAVAAAGRPMEVQFDEHKSIVVYARDRRPFRDIARSFGLRRCEDLVLVSEVRHVHRSTPRLADRFRDLAAQFDS